MGLVVQVMATLILSVMLVDCGDDVPKKKCATLFSSEDSLGAKLVLKDFDQSPELERDYRSSAFGWFGTKSVKVEQGCELKYFSVPYFKGNNFTELPSNPLFSLMGGDKDFSEANSATCTCERKCSCNDIVIPKEENSVRLFGRGYLEGGCKACNTPYIKFKNEDPNISWLNESLAAVVLRSGCTLTLYASEDYDGQATTISNPVHEGNLKASSYKIACNDADYVATPAKSAEPSSVKKIDLPPNKKALTKMSNELAKHPGFKAALKSAENGRSPKNAYVIFIGTNDVFSRGFPQCQIGTANKIGECRIPVVLDKLGVSAELRVITVPMSDVPDEADYKLLAGLAKYVSTHEELQNAIPNAVIIHHWLWGENDESANFVYHRKLGAIQVFRARLLDKRYSNAMFLLDTSNDRLTFKQRRSPRALINFFEKEYLENCVFPNPVVFSLQLDPQSQLYFVNGYAKMDDGEFWPKNFHEKIDNICANGGDKLGQAIFRAVFQDKITPEYSIPQHVVDISVGDDEWVKFRDATCSTPPLAGPKIVFPNISTIEVKDLDDEEEDSGGVLGDIGNLFSWG